MLKACVIFCLLNLGIIGMQIQNPGSIHSKKALNSSELQKYPGMLMIRAEQILWNLFSISGWSSPKQPGDKTLTSTDVRTWVSVSKFQGDTLGHMISQQCSSCEKSIAAWPVATDQCIFSAQLGITKPSG